jgi:hypothetical protein
MEAQRISPEEAHTHVASGEALLVCAYDSDEKFQENRLPGAMSFAEFRGREGSLSKNQEIIFYCS